MSDLVEHILTNNLVGAKELFEERMNIIAQRKLVEMKKMMQAEAEGKYGQYMGKSDWAKYRKQHPSLGMYDTPAGKGKKPESKVEKKRKEGYVQAGPALKALQFIKAVRKYHETGKIDESEGKFIQQQIKPQMRGIEKAVKRKEAGQKGQPYTKPSAEPSKEKEPETKPVKTEPPKKKSGYSELDWMTKAKRRRMLDAKVKKRTADIEASKTHLLGPGMQDPGARASRVKSALAKAHTRDVLRGAGQKAGHAYGVWMQKEKPKSLAGKVLSGISQTLSAASRG